MRLLWLCNQMPGAVREAVRGDAAAGGLWLDQVLDGLRQQGLRIHILCPGGGEEGKLDEGCSYATFREGLPYVYLPELEAQFEQIIQTVQPEIIHIWGTEYGHTLAMVNAAEKQGLLERTVINIQGLVGICGQHYAEGVPYGVLKGYTFRDFVRQDNLVDQQRKFLLRGQLETAALEKVRHVIGRTRWDYACTRQLSPQAEYHFCNETLRKPFYAGQWRYESCQKHRIFAPGFLLPLKGMHYVLEAFGMVAKNYPGAVLAVPGKSFLTEDSLRQTRYRKYLAELARELGVADRIEFLGKLTGEQMRAAYLQANVFVLASTVENSPNSLGEAMLLGTPCVAADVGGVTGMLVHNAEGYVYPSSEVYLLAYYIQKVFAMEEKAEAMGQAASAHARQTHDPERNLQTLLEIYETIR